MADLFTDTPADLAAIKAALGVPVSADVQVFTASGTWTKPAGAKTVNVYVLTGSGGGGSGARTAVGTASSGGAGGHGAAYTWATDFPASVLGATETVTVGAAGVGGAPVTTNDTAGNAGTLGGASSFGSWLTTVVYASVVAPGGAINANTASPTFGAYGRVSGNGGVQGVNAAAGVNNSIGTLLFGHAGASGAGQSTTPASRNGGNGGYADKRGQTLPAGGVGATKTAALAGASYYTIDGPFPAGTAGGGGWANADGTAGAGGAGGTFGGGGGGGGSSNNGSASGAGGDGTPGKVVVVTYF